MSIKYLKYTISILIFIIPIYIYFNPPHDRDAGPMMAYDFLFFYPFLLISILLSLFILFSAVKNFNSNKLENSLFLISTFPTIGLLILVFISFSKVNNSVEDFSETITNRKFVQINDKLTIIFEGSRYKNVRKKVSFLPNNHNVKVYTSSQFVQGRFNTFFMFYKIKNDSLEIYIPENEPLYYTNDGLKKLPIKVFYFNSNKKDSLNNQNLTNFEWK